MGRKVQGKTLFFPAKSKKFAKIISVESPAKALISVKILEREYKNSKTRANKIKIKQRTVLAANRANATLKRTDLTLKERSEFIQIERIYRESAKRMKID